MNHQKIRSGNRIRTICDTGITGLSIIPALTGLNQNDTAGTLQCRVFNRRNDAIERSEVGI